MHLGVVDDATQETVRNTRSAARTRGDLVGGLRVDGRAQQRGGTGDHRLQFIGLVELEVGREAEAVAQRGRQQAGSRRRAHDRKGRKGERDRRRAGPLAHDDVDTEVLHGEVEHFLGGSREAVDLVDEEDVALLEAGENRGEVTSVLDRGAGRQSQGRSHLGGDDHCQRRLAESRRARKQDVVGAGRAHARSVKHELQLASHDALAHKLRELLGA